MEFFTQTWVEAFARKWNSDAEMVDPLAQIAFNAIVALGYPNAETPSVLFEVENGKIRRAGLYNRVAKLPSINWDLRALPEQWTMWQSKPLALSGLSVEVQNEQLQFKVGDYRKLIRTPNLANPFLRFFKLL
jgi:hypothetical protein